MHKHLSGEEIEIFVISIAQYGDEMVKEITCHDCLHLSAEFAERNGYSHVADSLRDRIHSSLAAKGQVT